MTRPRKGEKMAKVLPILEIVTDVSRKDRRELLEREESIPVRNLLATRHFSINLIFHTIRCALEKCGLESQSAISDY